MSSGFTTALTHRAERGVGKNSASSPGVGRGTQVSQDDDTWTWAADGRENILVGLIGESGVVAIFRSIFRFGRG